MEEKLERLREFFKGDRFAMEAGCRIDSIGENAAVCSLTIQDMHRNAMGNVMGGVSFTLADFAVAVAANQDAVGSVALDANATFLGRAKGARLIAEANCVKNGRTTGYYQVMVKDDLGNAVAAVNVTVFHTVAR